MGVYDIIQNCCLTYIVPSCVWPRSRCEYQEFLFPNLRVVIQEWGNGNLLSPHLEVKSVSSLFKISSYRNPVEKLGMTLKPKTKTSTKDVFFFCSPCIILKQFIFFPMYSIHSISSCHPSKAHSTRKACPNATSCHIGGSEVYNNWLQTH